MPSLALTLSSVSRSAAAFFSAAASLSRAAVTASAAALPAFALRIGIVEGDAGRGRAARSDADDVSSAVAPIERQTLDGLVFALALAHECLGLARSQLRLQVIVVEADEQVAGRRRRSFVLADDLDDLARGLRGNANLAVLGLDAARREAAHGALRARRIRCMSGVRGQRHRLLADRCRAPS